jgi:hypothetical protein
MRRRSNPQDTTWHSAAAAGGGLRINQLTAEARPGLLNWLYVYASMASHVAGLWASRRRDLIVGYESESAGAAALAHVATGEIPVEL